MGFVVPRTFVSAAETGAAIGRTRNLLQTVLVLIRLFTANDRTPEGLVFFGRRHHQRGHLLQDEGRVRPGRELAQVEVHGLQMLLQLLLHLELLVESPLLASHLCCPPRAEETLGGVIDGAQGAESQAAKLSTAQVHVAKVHLHGHAREIFILVAVAVLSELLTSLRQSLLGGQSRRVDRRDCRVVLKPKANSGRCRRLGGAKRLVREAGAV